MRHNLQPIGDFPAAPIGLANLEKEWSGDYKIRVEKTRIAVKDLTCDSSFSLGQPHLDSVGLILRDSEGILHRIQMEVHPSKIASCIGVQGLGLISLLKKTRSIIPW